MQMYDDGFKSITSVDVRHIQYFLLYWLIAWYPSIPPQSSIKCDVATRHYDQEWNVSGFRDLLVHAELTRFVKGWWQTSRTYPLTLVRSTSPSIKVGVFNHLASPYVSDVLFQGRWTQ